MSKIHYGAKPPIFKISRAEQTKKLKEHHARMETERTQDTRIREPQIEEDATRRNDRRETSKEQWQVGGCVCGEREGGGKGEGTLNKEPKVQSSIFDVGK